MNDQLAGQVLEALNDKVDIDYGNMPANSTNYAPSSKNVTNCITEIPQDIKLELADGAITLKANSKLYQPNDSGVFTPIVMSTDKARSDFSLFGSGTYLLFYSQSYGGLVARNIKNCVSGATDTSTATSHTWYDTTNNKIKIYENGSYTLVDLTLPLCVFDNTYGTGVTSIKNVFNGFGYIGYTIFALPGVKGLIPNGHNTDGTLSNTVFTVGSVKTIGYATAYNDYTVSLSAGSIGIWVAGRLVYDEQTNHNVNTQNNSVQALTICGKVSCDGTRITSFTPKTAFRAVDYSDTEYMARQVIASDRYIDLTLGTSGASYTAPADGWLVLNKLSSGTSYQFVQLYNTKNADRRIGASTTNSAYLCATMPLAKGDRVLVEYSATGVTKVFRFIYANGAK